MSQKRKRSKNSKSYWYGTKRYKAAEDYRNSSYSTGRSRSYERGVRKNITCYQNNRYSNKNIEYIMRNGFKRRNGSWSCLESRNKSNGRKYKRKYSKRHWPKRYNDTRSSSKSSYYSRSSCSSSDRSSRSRSSSSSSASTQVQRSKSVLNDKDGHLVCKPGDKIMNRYVVQSILGEGTFGRVIECVDLIKDERPVAMKVVRNVRRYRDAAKLEVNVLNTLKRNDPHHQSHCIRMLDWFQFHGHVCITFAKMGDSLFDFLKKNDFQCFEGHQVRHISYQLCKSVLFMHKNKLTHTDLKPENILFHDSTADVSYHSNKAALKVRCCNIELIDFGSATFDREHHSSVVSTRHYRAPEVLLELGWSQPCDVWSIGCIMFELYTGNTLFQTHNNLEHMAMMERILGPLPSSMIRKTRRSKYFYHGRLDWDEDSSSGRYVKEHCRNLHKYMKGQSEEEKSFFHLMSQMLQYDEERRITLSQALKHPYFSSLAQNDNYNNNYNAENHNSINNCNGNYNNYSNNNSNNYNYSSSNGMSHNQPRPDSPRATDGHSGFLHSPSKSNSFISKGIYADYKGDLQTFSAYHRSHYPLNHYQPYPSKHRHHTPNHHRHHHNGIDVSNGYKNFDQKDQRRRDQVGQPRGDVTHYVHEQLLPHRSSRRRHHQDTRYRHHRHYRPSDQYRNRKR